MRKPLFAAVLLLSLVAATAGPARSQFDPCGPPNPVADPYVFILLDISGSMNHTTNCSGSYQCFTSMQGDHPDSKWVQARQALYNVLSTVEGVNFGFATFSNQDALRVCAKHWLYQADTAGPVMATSFRSTGTTLIKTTCSPGWRPTWPWIRWPLRTSAPPPTSPTTRCPERASCA